MPWTACRSTIRLVRPDEVEAHRYTLTESKAGGYAAGYPDLGLGPHRRLDPCRPISIPRAIPSAASTSWSRMSCRRRSRPSSPPRRRPSSPASRAKSTLQSDYLYGAPGADLLVKASVTIEQNSDPFANAFPGYYFGLVDEKVEPQVETWDDTTTDAKGQASFDMTPTDLPDTPQPLKATLRTEVYEFGGRPVIKTLTLPVRNKPISLGIKPQFSDDAVASGVDAGFEVIAVNKAGARAAANGVQYRLVPEDWDYQWFYQGLELGLQDRHPRQAGRGDGQAGPEARRRPPSSRSRSIGATTVSRSMTPPRAPPPATASMPAGAPHRVPATRRTASRSSPTRRCTKRGRRRPCC